ncbi:MAG: two component transcriptional regulator, LuxR family [Nocardioides sp.]|jgi:NarL family two-component system response regulator LiaR|uniref:helix-turn-helix transcriptional regulator n=1 Tax=Nocardioides sp. TaxID=35761 RepID=UPI002619CEA8|nr:response regulator transcription factor [Nocardioides sp.]MCW2832296.1 two component transcriptional regulator, LuxR family [Nocardioides sp.]
MTDAAQPLLVMVVNDFPVVTAGVAALLAPYGKRVEVVGSEPPTRPVNVLLLDTFAHPDPEGRLLHVLEQTTAVVLVYGWAESQQQIDAATRLGAAGFLSKTVDGEQIVAAVEAAAAGRAVRSAPAPKDTAMAAWPGQGEGLSPRESEVLSLIVSGLSNQDIARSTFLSINSVKTYIRTAYRKMAVASRSQAVLWGIEHGFRVDHAPSWREGR